MGKTMNKRKPWRPLPMPNELPEIISPDLKQLIDIYNRDLEKGVITMDDYGIFMSRVDRLLLGRD